MQAPDGTASRGSSSPGPASPVHRLGAEVRVGEESDQGEESDCDYKEEHAGQGTYKRGNRDRAKKDRGAFGRGSPAS